MKCLNTSRFLDVLSQIKHIFYFLSNFQELEFLSEKIAQIVICHNSKMSHLHPLSDM